MIRMRRLWSVMLLMIVLTACTEQPSASVNLEGTSDHASEQTLIIGAYGVAKDALQLIVPEFQREWKEQTGKTIEFQLSYEASGTQARSIVGGMEADIAVLAMEGDVDKLAKADLIPKDWKARDPYAGMVTRSIVVIGTRAGNPLGIQDWQDLTRKDVDVLYPNPKTSGGAQWDINAVYGAGLMIAKEQGQDGEAYAKSLLKSIHERVISMDKSGRASMAAFEYGVGDAIITYENELLSRIKQGVNYEIVVPKYTIQIENPVTVVDRYVDKHGTREAAEAFVAFLRSEQAQELWVEAGFQPVIDMPGVVTMQAREGVFTIEDMGGWDHVRELLYSKRGVWYQVLAGL